MRILCDREKQETQSRGIWWIPGDTWKVRLEVDGRTLPGRWQFHVEPDASIAKDMPQRLPTACILVWKRDLVKLDRRGQNAEDFLDGEDRQFRKFIAQQGEN
jgi:hypothetical protein